MVHAMAGVGSEVKHTNDIINAIDNWQERREKIYGMYMALQFVEKESEG